MHFDSNQFEQHRQDGARRLKPNAVPTLFGHCPLKSLRRPPTKRSPYTSPRQQSALKRLKVEHTYAPSLPKSSNNRSVAAAGM